MRRKCFSAVNGGLKTDLYTSFTATSVDCQMTETIATLIADRPPLPVRPRSEGLKRQVRPQWAVNTNARDTM